MNIASLLVLCLLPTDFVIENATLETGDGTVLSPASVWVDDAGIIRGVGTSLRVPAGTQRINGSGRTLTPGLIESQSQLGLTEVLMEASADDTTLSTPSPVPTPALRAADGFNPHSVRIPITREEGVTTAIISPEGKLLYGMGYAADLSGTLATRPSPQTPIALFGGLTAHDLEAAGDSRGGAWLRLREIFDDVRFYDSQKTDFDEGDMRALSLSRVHLEAMVPVVQGRLPLVLRVHRAVDLLAAIEFQKEQKIRLIVTGAAEAWLVAKELAAAGIPVILQPSIQAPYSFDAFAARDDSAALLAKAGVTLLVTAGEDWDENQRRLRQEAGIAVAHGLPRNAAIRAITQTPAQVFGLPDRGAISVGKRADLVLWSGDPLELSTVVEKLWIAGREQSLDTRQKALARRYLPEAR